MQKKKGISLIVLVITIIVMIILAATIILSITNNNVVNRAEEAVDESNLKQIQETAQVAWADAYVSGRRTEGDLETYVMNYLKENGMSDAELNKYIIDVTTTGVTVTLKDNTSSGGDTTPNEPESKPQEWTLVGEKVVKGDEELYVGDYVNYKSNVTGYTDDNGWQVLGAENGQILLLSTATVGELTLSSDDDLEEAKSDYKTGVAQMDAICEPFGKGEKAEKAISINADHIKPLIGTYLDQDNNYGTTETYKWKEDLVPRVYYEAGWSSNLIDEHTKGFIWYDFENKEWRKATKSTTSSATNHEIIVDDTDSTKQAIIKNTMINCSSGDVPEGKIRSMIFKSEYWIASPFIGDGRVALAHGFPIADVNNILNTILIFSTEYIYDVPNVGVRAVVYLDSNVSFTAGDTEDSWNIK